MVPSHLHYNNLNVEDFSLLMPEYAKWAGPMAVLLEQYARRRRCRNTIDQAGLSISHERIIQVEKDCEILTQESYDKWAKEDAEDDTRAIIFPTEPEKPT